MQRRRDLTAPDERYMYAGVMAVFVCSRKTMDSLNFWTHIAAHWNSYVHFVALRKISLARVYAASMPTFA